MPWKTKIIGRAAEIAELDAQWQRAAAGEFRFVLLLGEPGVGKTRLAAEALESRLGPCLALSARGRPLGATASFGLLAEALEHHLRTLPLAEVRRLCGGLLDDMASLLRTVAAIRGAAPKQEPPRPRLLEGLAVLMANLTQQAPLVVVLDDVQLADDSSWDALHYLAGSLATERILVMAAARPAELAEQSAAGRVLLDLEQRGVLHRLEVTPLGEEAVRELAEEMLGATVSGGLAEWLSARARGNPLFVLGLLQALLDEGADLANPALRTVPEGLAEQVRVRMERLSEDERAILDLLAVAGSRVELGDLMALARLPLEELGDVLQRLVRARLVAEEEQGRKFAYEISHPLIREIVYDDIVGARQVGLHRQVGRALLTMGRLGEAALHFARSAEAGDSEAMVVLSGALRQAEERGAYQEALRILRALVELLPPGDRRWVEVADGFSRRAEWVFDHRADTDFRTAIEALRAIDSQLEGSGDLLGRAAIKARLTSLLSWGTGQTDEAEQRAREALDLYDRAGDRPGALLAALELAYVQAHRGDLAALESGARQVLAAAEEASDRPAQLRAAGVLGTALFYQGHFAEAEAALRTSIAMARDDDNLYRLTWGLMSLGWSLGFEGRLGEALELFAEAKATNPAWRDSNLLELEGHVRWLAGDLQGALGCAHESFSLSSREVSRRRGMSPSIAALATADTGALDDAASHVASASRIYGDDDWWYATDIFRHAAAVLAWREGRLDEARVGLDRAAGRMLSIGARAFVGPVLVDLAEVAALSGAPAAAAEASETLEKIAATIDRDLFRGLAALAGAVAGVAGGRLVVADRAREAVGILEGSGYAVFLGRALNALGRSSDDHAEAANALERALDVFDDCHALWHRNRVLQALQGLGARGRRAAAFALGPASLSSRELQVARLAAQRLTPVEIARELFISRRTVEGHLANVYAKLGVHSKHDFGQQALALGILDHPDESANP